MQEGTWDPAVEEQKRVIAQHGPKITLEALADMPVLHRNVQEAIRLFPPLILLLRQVHKDFSVTTSAGATYLVPKVRPTPPTPTPAIILTSALHSSGFESTKLLLVPPRWWLDAMSCQGST